MNMKAQVTVDDINYYIENNKINDEDGNYIGYMPDGLSEDQVIKVSVSIIITYLNSYNAGVDDGKNTIINSFKNLLKIE